jgi:hypothetical protein
MGLAGANGTSNPTRFAGSGACVLVIIVLCREQGSHSVHQAISLARSVTNSEIAHQVGGLGDPPNVSLSDT